MSLTEGDAAPDFSMAASFSRVVALVGQRGRAFLLYFYPKADTPGCTKEACHFRDVAADYQAVGAQRVGISMDSVDKQKQFSDQNNFDYPLLADAEGTVAKVWKKVNVDGHDEEVIAALKELK